MADRCPVDICDRTERLEDSVDKLIEKIDGLTAKLNEVLITMSNQSIKMTEFDKRCECLEKIAQEVSQIRTELAVLEDRQNRSLVAGAAGGLGGGSIIVAFIEIIRYLLGVGR